MNNLILIINEEVNNFISEVKEYADDDFIDSNDINLQHEYDKLNQQLFNSELPRVTLRWGKRKTSLGHVHSMYNRFTREVRILYLEISMFYKTTYRQFKNVLAHEMIHVKQLAINKERGGHGFSFYKEAYRINGMGIGYKITEKNTEEIEVSAQMAANAIARGKTFIALIINLDGKYWLNVTTPNVYERDADGIFEIYNKLVNKAGKYNNVEITVIESKNPALMRYPIVRSYQRRIPYASLNDQLLEQLLDEKIIKNVRIKRGAPMEISEDAIAPNASSGWEEEDIV